MNLYEAIQELDSLTEAKTPNKKMDIDPTQPEITEKYDLISSIVGAIDKVRKADFESASDLLGRAYNSVQQAIKVVSEDAIGEAFEGDAEGREFFIKRAEEEREALKNKKKQFKPSKEEQKMMDIANRILAIKGMYRGSKDAQALKELEKLGKEILNCKQQLSKKFQ